VDTQTTIVNIDLRKHIQRHEFGKISPVTADNYLKAIRYVGIEIVNSNEFETVWNVLVGMLESGKSPNIIQNFYNCLMGACNRVYGIDIPRSESRTHFEDLMSTLRAERQRNPQPYKTKEVRAMLNATLEDGKFGLFRFIVLAGLGGLRSSSIEGIRFSDIKPVEGVEGAYDIIVRKAKGGKPYHAIIAQNAKDWLMYDLETADDVLCPFANRSEGGSFYDSYRRKFNRFCEGHGFVFESKDRQISSFHSLRKWHNTRLEASGVDWGVINVLSGRTAGKEYKVLLDHYLNVKGESSRATIQKCAKAYVSSKLARFSLEDPKPKSETVVQIEAA
jgi:hypothetical protein